MQTSAGPSRIARVAWAAMTLWLGCVVAVACGTDTSATVPGAVDDGGEPVDAGPPPPVSCPSSAPAEGAGCSLPEGTTCDFGLCGTRIARCARGAWQYGANPLPEATCPATPPEADAACPPCWPAGKSCVYGSLDCTSPDASANTATAVCASGQWSVVVRPCREGGADVQDASLDADLSDDAAPDAD